MFTQNELKECISYDERTGVFIWIKTYRNQNLGKVAGSFGKDGYLFITVRGRHYAASRLAWFYVYGVWPNGVIDHKDHVVTNNSIGNLRDVSYAENSQNQIKAHKDNFLTGLLGVRYNRVKNRFQARIQINGKRIPLGGFATASEAHAAYVLAKRKLHGTCVI